MASATSRSVIASARYWTGMAIVEVAKCTSFSLSCVEWGQDQDADALSFCAGPSFHDLRTARSSAFQIGSVLEILGAHLAQ